MRKRQMVAFDFDGTLIRRDSLLEFIRFVFGNVKLVIGLARYMPVIIAAKLGLYHNGKAKEKVFSYFFGGMSYATFRKYGEVFAGKLDSMLKAEGMELLEYYQRSGFTVFVVSASVEEWVRPWCNNHQIRNVIGTQVETLPNGVLSGRFRTPNCYGAEKRRRFLETEPNRDEYVLHVYGDSRGDKELIEFADFGKII